MKVSSIPLPPQPFIDNVGGGNFSKTGQHLFELLRDRCALKPNNKIFDLGSGCGRLAIPLTQYLDEDGEYDGLDIVLPMVEWCRTNISSRFPRFRFHHTNLKNTAYNNNNNGADSKNYTFPFADGAFDVVVATSVFTHLIPQSADRYAKEVARVLKDDGCALLTFFLMTEDYDKNRAAGLVKFDFTDRHSGHAFLVKDNPEAAVGYDEHHALPMLRSAGLSVDAISYGSWSNHLGCWSFQDVILVSKAQISRPPYPPD